LSSSPSLPLEVQWSKRLCLFSTFTSFGSSVFNELSFSILTIKNRFLEAAPADLKIAEHQPLLLSKIVIKFSILFLFYQFKKPCQGQDLSA